MAGVSADLELRAAQALRTVDRVESALRRSVQTFGNEFVRTLASITARQAAVTITADTEQITPSVTAAVDAADVQITPTADAAEVTGSLNAAVEAADTHVAATADASEVKGSIEGAVQAAETLVRPTAEAGAVTGSINAAVDAADTRVSVTADTGEAAQAIADLGQQVGVLGDEGSFLAGSVREALEEVAGEAAVTEGSVRGATEGIAGGLASARGQALGLKTTIAGLATGAAVVGIGNLIGLSSDLAESQSKVNVVFGDGAGEISAFAETASQSVGLANQDALEFAGTFGNLLQALGTTREEATKLSPDIIQLGADLASFNNLQVDETLEKIRSGLVGEVEPLRALGVSFGAAEVEAEAFRIAQEKGRKEITEGDKVLARYKLIVDQTGFAQGDFARTSEGLANRQRIANARFKDARTELGTKLVPLMEDVVLPLFDTFIDVVGVMASAVGGLSDAIGATGGFLNAAGPAIGDFLNPFDGASVDVQELATALADGVIGMDQVRSEAGLLAPIVFDLADKLRVLNEAGGGTEGGFNLIETALGKFGLTLDEIFAKIEEARDVFDPIDAEVREFSRTLAESATEVSEATGEIDGAFSPGALIEQLRARTTAIANFQTNVQALLDQGFTNLAQLALERGPEAGGIIAQELIESSPEIRSSAEQALSEFEKAQAGLVLRTTNSFGLELSGVINEAQPQIATAAGLMGAAVIGNYAPHVALIPETTREALVGAGGAIQGSVAIGVGILASQAGKRVAGSFSDGFSGGLVSNESIRAARDSAAQLVRAAEEAARREARSSSPSRLFAEIGADLGIGMAQGLAAQASAVAAASRTVLAAAASGTGAQLVPVVRPAVLARPPLGDGGAGGGSSSTSITNHIYDTSGSPEATAVAVSRRIAQRATR